MFQLHARLKNRELIMMDGAMGTLLQERYALPGGRPPEEINLLSPSTVQEVHEAYLQAGSNIILTNTFGANRLKMQSYGLCHEAVISSAIDNAKAASEKYGALVALDIGPLGKLLEPMGTLRFEEAYELFAQQVRIGADRGADLIYIETMSDLYEAKAAVLAAKENSTLPVFVTMTFDHNHRTFTGCDADSIALTLEGLGVDALGVNCSLGPKELLPVLEQLAKRTALPLIAKPNAGLPRVADNQTVFEMDSQEFADSMGTLAQMGVNILGGCCGTAPEYISLTKTAAETAYQVRTLPKRQSAISSGTQTLNVEKVLVIGERINPTGKKAFKEALMNNDIGYILHQAVEQVDGGADLLDVNVGLPGIDEKEMMIRVVKALQSVVNCPLQIDSNDPAVIEAALRIYNGKAIVNSVTGEEQSLESILPIIKKYGAAVVGLTLDNNGIPQTAEKRYEIAEKILMRAQSIGIPKEDVFIDCLTLTIAADQQNAQITLDAVKKIKQMNLKTVLGVSNVSFGLPMRNKINNTFLTMALQSGLDLPIINPNAQDTMEIVNTYRLLVNQETSAHYIARYAESTEALTKPSSKRNETENLEYLIINGIQQGITQSLDALLVQHDAMEIINTHLIPALDKVGSFYESGKIFLPQLISSAEASKTAFEYLRHKVGTVQSSVSDPRQIIVATVKGDVHDIGKNIVKVVLQNYGFSVIDLGYDTDIDLIVDTAKKNDMLFVGLSSLMTTSLKSMEETIVALRDSGYTGAIVVGGAVLDNDYAKKIGATYYAKDAMATVHIAKELLV